MSAIAFVNEKIVTIDSSSGGAFMAIAKHFLSVHPSGIVFGVEYRDGIALYSRATYLDECRKFQGSKYIRADMKNSINEILDLLRRRIPVLFSGIPCQVYAVKQAAQKENVGIEHLYLVELICHGTAKQSIFDAYLTWIEKRNKAKISNFKFRDKTVSWGGYPCSIVFDSGKTKSNTYDVMTFSRLFFSHYIMNESCYNCKFKKVEREADITIGDMWGAKDIVPQMSMNRGISLVISNNGKGDSIVEALKEMGKKNDEISFCDISDERYLPYQTSLVGNYMKPAKAAEFCNTVFEIGFDYACKKYGFFDNYHHFRFAMSKQKKAILQMVGKCKN